MSGSSYIGANNPYPKVLILSHGSAYYDDDGGGFAPSTVIRVCRSMAENKNFWVRIFCSNIRTFRQKVLILNIFKSSCVTTYGSDPFVLSAGPIHRIEVSKMSILVIEDEAIVVVEDEAIVVVENKAIVVVESETTVVAEVFSL